MSANGNLVPFSTQVLLSFFFPPCFPHRNFIHPGHGSNKGDFFPCLLVTWGVRVHSTRIGNITGLLPSRVV